MKPGARGRIVHVSCANCAKDIARSLSRLSGHDRHFCSRECQIAKVKTEGWRAEGFMDKRRRRRNPFSYAADAALERFFGGRP